PLAGADHADQMVELRLVPRGEPLFGRHHQVGPACAVEAVAGDAARDRRERELPAMRLEAGSADHLREALDEAGGVGEVRAEEQHGELVPAVAGEHVADPALLLQDARPGAGRPVAPPPALAFVWPPPARALPA